MSEAFLSDEENLAELVSHMPEEDQLRWNNYGHLRIEPAFVDRVLVVYKPTGLLPNKQHRDPEILNLVKIVDFKVLGRLGCTAMLEEAETQQQMTITHVPKRLFGYPVYVSIPARVMVRWDVRVIDGKPWRSLSFAMLVKSKNKSSFYSKGNVYAESPNVFRNLYPSVTGKFTF
jgi:hypothetical protein